MMEEKNKKKYYCPRCKNEKIIEDDDFIHCPKCARDFDKELIGVVDDENILSRQELERFLDAFSEEEKKRLFENKS